MNNHVLSTYDDELNELRSIVSRMGGLAGDQLKAAMTALQESDMEAAETVRLADKKLDLLERLAEETVIGVFARRAPVANDLREVVGTLKIINVLERIGDYAKNIAKRTIAINSTQPIPMPKPLENMAKTALQMIQAVMDAYAHKNAASAVEVWESDRLLDDLHNSAYEEIMGHMMAAPDKISRYAHFLMIAKNLERIGDQTTNIAEQIYYTITGKWLDEARPKHDLTSETIVE